MKTCILIFIFFPAAGSLFAQWTTNNATNEFYNAGSNARIGIGTSAPAYGLHLLTSGDLQGIHLNYNNQKWLTLFSPSMTAFAFNGMTKAGDAGIIFGSPAYTPNAPADFGFVIAPHLAGVSGLRINGDGNVGIGITSPGGRLHIRDSPYWSSYNYGAALVVDGPHHNAVAILDVNNSNPVALANVSGDFTIAKMPPLGNTTNNPEQLMVIKPSGHVGIRTSTPQSNLDVRNPDSGEGQTVAIANFTFGGQNHFSSGEGKIVLGSEAYSNGIMKRAEIGFTASGWYGGGSLKFYTTPDDETYVPQVRMTIDPNGNIGVGTNDPDERLTVRGTIHTNEVRVDAAGNVIPDYVFEKDYNLLPLAELEAYINQNKHLPEVPSANEMEEEGLNLKEMNLILLRKIEELTLHVIGQNKEIALLKQHPADSGLSEKKVEELMLHEIEQQKQIDELKREIDRIKKLQHNK